MAKKSTFLEILTGLVDNPDNANHNLASWLPNALSDPEPHRLPRVYYKSERTELFANGVEDLLKEAEKDREQHRVCIIEDIRPYWIEHLGQKWNLDPQFFIDHARNPSTRHPSRNNAVKNEDLHLFKNQDNCDEAIPQCQGQATTFLHFGPRVHLPGSIAFPGWVNKSKTSTTTGLNSTPSFFRRDGTQAWNPFMISFNTKISICFPLKNLALFLVDGPIDLSTTCRQTVLRSRPVIRFNVNPGGIQLPLLLSNPFSAIFDSLVIFFEDIWHLKILLNPVQPDRTLHLWKREVCRPQDPLSLGMLSMIYMLSASIWTINLQFLDQKIKQISFAELREPSVEINSRLHDCRQDLEYLRDGVMNIHKHETPGDVNAILALFDDLKPGDSSSGVTRNAFKQLDQDVSNLSAFLMDSFQLLMSTIATLDAQTSLEQANRGSRLTQLAFIYIPLSFVTGIFGMNLKEINGSPLSAWVTVVSLFILALFTAIIFWLLRMFEKRRANKV